MKLFRKFCAALVLSAALVLPIFAGDVQFPGASNSSQPPQPCVIGDVQFPGATPECKSVTADTADTEYGIAVDPVTGITLTLLESLLSIF